MDPVTDTSTHAAARPGTSARRGRLRVLLGAAPGVGKTFAMLNEGRRRAERGTDVVVAYVETHGREQTAAQLQGIELVPRQRLRYRGAEFEEMDIDAVLARAPQVALVDELAHTNVPGSRNRRRADDVEELLAAGIDVITTVNVQHLESLNDVVEQITGIKQRETVPDAVVRAADQLELVDMAPEALRRRMAHGNIYAPDKVDAALRNYFRPGNLQALRELALLWVADRVDAALHDYRRDKAISATWQTRERVVVALSGGPEGATLIRRGARIANKGVGGELIAVYVARSDGLVHSDREELLRQRKLVEDLQGSFHTLSGDDPASVVLDCARSVNATQIVVGTTRSSRWQRLFREPIDRRIVAGSGDIDVSIVSHAAAASGEHRAVPALGGRRRLLGALASVTLPFLLAWLLSLSSKTESQSFALMTFLALTVGVALVGGLIPAMVTAVLGSLLVNWFFTPPLGTLTIADPRNLASMVIFVVVGLSVALVVDKTVRRAHEAAVARREADTLFMLTNETVRDDLTAESALDLVRETFRLDAVQLRSRPSVTAPWSVDEQVGQASGEPDTEIVLNEHLHICCFGAALTPPDERVLTAFGGQFLARRERDTLRAQAGQIGELEARDSLQTALLAAVSHDLRTPLAAIKASSSSLLSRDVEWSAEDRAALLEMIDDNADRLERLIANLLDMTRIRTAQMPVLARDVLPDELLGLVMRSVDAARVRVDVAPGLPQVSTDAGLAERILGNVIDNAVRHAPEGTSVDVVATLADEEAREFVCIAVADHGVGVSADKRDAMFSPFQRVGDAPEGNGLGLGLAVARGFAQAIGARLVATETPGGGLTMELWLPVAQTEGPHE